ncbi:putative tail fiber protein [Microcystis phage Mel-JY34]
MALESATFLEELVGTNPTGSDNRSEGDDHIRLVKSVLKSTLPGLAGRAWRVQSKSGGYTAVVNDNMSVLHFTATATLNLPAAATAGNGYMLIVSAASSQTVTIDGNSSETINGVATAAIDTRDIALLFCTGTEWFLAWIQNASSTTLTAPTLTRPVIGSARETISVANASGAQAIDVSPQGYFAYTLTGNVTFSFSNVPSTGTAIAITIELIQGGSGSYTVTWPGTVKWPSNVAPVLTTTVGKIDVVTLVTRDGGASWLGFVAGQNF